MKFELQHLKNIRLGKIAQWHDNATSYSCLGGAGFTPLNRIKRPLQCQTLFFAKVNQMPSKNPQGKIQSPYTTIVFLQLVISLAHAVFGHGNSMQVT